MARILLGLDVGGSSIKGGLVDVAAGALCGELQSVQTPHPANPANVMLGVRKLAELLPSSGPVGFAFPTAIRRKRAQTAAHVDQSWIGVDGAELIRQTLGRPAAFLNDADAAGIAEMRCGAGKGVSGVVMMLTFGTGIGTALFIDGKLVPNTELGHIELHGRDAEEWASARVRTAEHLDFAAWSARVNEFLARMNALFWPDLFILGGAVSERFAEFAPLLKSSVEVVAAHFAGQAGTIGAAFAAAELV